MTQLRSKPQYLPSGKLTDGPWQIGVGRLVSIKTRLCSEAMFRVYVNLPEAIGFSQSFQCVKPKDACPFEKLWVLRNSTHMGYIAVTYHKSTLW